MSFEIFQQSFGNLTEYVIHDKTTENRCVIVPELGGIVRQLSLRKDLTLFSILETPPTPDRLISDSKSASELLFPFASRIPNGTYTFLGKQYQLEHNEEGAANAIHGLIRKKHFQLEEQDIHQDHAFIKLSYILNDIDGYPFHVRFSVKYTLSAGGKFSLEFEAENHDSVPCPVMFGWHPYFRLGNEMVDAWKIDIPSSTVVEFDANQIPLGTKPSVLGKPALLNKKELDNCFIVESETGTAATKLISENQHVTLQIEQETGEGKFNHLVIYTPPARNCVAIEPYTANVNAFNTGDGLNILAPGHTFGGTIHVSLI